MKIHHCAFLAVVVLRVSCATNPVTGERELALVSESQEIQIAREVAAQAEQQFGLGEDAALQAYVHRLGTQLAKASERPELPWTFKVVDDQTPNAFDDQTPNAFAAPGGFIFVTRGLLALVRNEAVRVSVLGHAIGHVTAGHGRGRTTATLWKERNHSDDFGWCEALGPCFRLRNRSSKACFEPVGRTGSTGGSIPSVPGNSTGAGPGRPTRWPTSPPCRVTRVVHDQAARQGISGQESLEKGLQEKAVGFMEKGTRIYWEA
jgi:hypothetical protein